jgi:uncharacterized phage infection (PIP) family protein YhgE
MEISLTNKEKQEKENYEFSKCQKYIALKEEEITNLKNSFEYKIQSQKMKNEELKYANEKLQREITNLKEMLKNLESNTSHINDNFLKSDYSELLGEKDYNKNLENMREVIA